MSIQNLLCQKARIERLTETVSADGAVISAWHTHLPSVACLLEKIVCAQSDAAAPRLRGYFPADTDLRPDHAAGAPDRAFIDGACYLIRSVTRYNNRRLSLILAELEPVRDS